jgi:hypothetical protein
MEKAGQRLPISAGRLLFERASDSRPEINRAALRSLTCSDLVSTECYQGQVSQAHAPGQLSILRCRIVLPTCTAPTVSSPLALGLRVPTREGVLVLCWFLKPFPFPHLSVALLFCPSVLLVGTGTGGNCYLSCALCCRVLLKS